MKYLTFNIFIKQNMTRGQTKVKMKLILIFILISWLDYQIKIFKEKMFYLNIIILGDFCEIYEMFDI